MKKHLALLVLLICLGVPARATVTVNLDAGELTSPISAPMQVDNAFPSSNGSLLLLIDLGAGNTINNILNPGQFVSGNNFILAAGGFNNNGGTNETNTTFNINSGAVNDNIALRWFPQITYAQYQTGGLTLAGYYFGTYAPSPLGSTPDGGQPWTLPSSGTVALNFYTTDSDGSGSQLPSAGFTNYQVQSVPEPSIYALVGIGLLALIGFARHKKTA